MMINAIRAYNPVIKNRLNNEAETKPIPAFKGKMIGVKGGNTSNTFRKQRASFLKSFNKAGKKLKTWVSNDITQPESTLNTRNKARGSA